MSADVKSKKLKSNDAHGLKLYLVA